MEGAYLAGVGPWRLWSLTRSEITCVLRASAARQKQAYEMAVFVAWRTATLSRAKKIPKLSKLIRSRKRKSAEEQAALRADIAALDAEFARLESAGRPGGTDGC